MQEFFGEYSAGMSLADPHIHTVGSDGRLKPAQVVQLALEHKLSTIAIADHEVIDPALKVQQYCLENGLPLEVVIGSEITSKNGHVVGLFLQKDIRSGKSLEYTIQEIHSQNGLVIAPHPMFWLTRSLGREKILSVIKNPHPEIYFDGFELFNSAVFSFLSSNYDARQFYLDHKETLGAPIGCSDAHRRSKFGTGLTGFHGNFRKAIESGKTAVFSQDLNPKSSLMDALDIALILALGLTVEPKRRIDRYLEQEINPALTTKTKQVLEELESLKSDYFGA